MPFHYLPSSLSATLGKIHKVEKHTKWTTKWSSRELFQNKQQVAKLKWNSQAQRILLKWICLLPQDVFWDVFVFFFFLSWIFISFTQEWPVSQLIYISLKLALNSESVMADPFPASSSLAFFRNRNWDAKHSWPFSLPGNYRWSCDQF